MSAYFAKYSDFTFFAKVATFLKKHNEILQKMLPFYKKPDKYIVLSSLQIIYLILNKSAKNRN